MLARHLCAQEAVSEQEPADTVNEMEKELRVCVRERASETHTYRESGREGARRIGTTRTGKLIIQDAFVVNLEATSARGIERGGGRLLTHLLPVDVQRGLVYLR